IICRTPCFVVPCSAAAPARPSAQSAILVNASTRHWCGSDLIASRGGKLSASFSKRACRSAYNIVIFFLNQSLLRKDFRGKFQLSRLRNIEQFLRLLVRLQQRAFSSLNHKQ